MPNRFRNYKYLLINHQQTGPFVKIYLILNFEVNTIYQFDLFSSFKLLDFDDNEYTNYCSILSLMLFDRWQHCRQMSDRARNIYNASSVTDTNNDTFINEIYTLISNTAYLASIVEENSTTKVN